MDNIFDFAFDLFNSLKNFASACWEVLNTPFGEAFQNLPPFLKTILERIVDILEFEDLTLIKAFPYLALISLLFVVVRAIIGE